MTALAERTSPHHFDWHRHPAAEAFLDDLLRRALAGNAFAAGLARRMGEETSTRFADWVDHLVLTDRPGRADELGRLGYRREPTAYGVGSIVLGHEGGLFPRLILAPGSGPEVREVAI